MQRVHDTVGQAIVRAGRVARSALRTTGGASPHALAAAAVTAGGALLATGAAGFGAPIATLAVDLATLGIAVHAVSRVRRRGRVLTPTLALIGRSARGVCRAHRGRPARWLSTYARARDGSLVIDRDAAARWLRRALVPAALGAVGASLPGVGPFVRGFGDLAAIARNHAFVRAVEREAERLVEADCARVPLLVI